jgi:hypothetical protein
VAGSNLGSGTDITAVTLGGVAATIVSQSATQAVVTAGAGNAVGAVNVTVRSTSFGTATRADGFSYFQPCTLPGYLSPLHTI